MTQYDAFKTGNAIRLHGGINPFAFAKVITCSVIESYETGDNELVMTVITIDGCVLFASSLNVTVIVADSDDARIMHETEMAFVMSGKLPYNGCFTYTEMKGST